MKITFSKPAKKIVDSLTIKEKSIFDLCTQYLWEDMQHIKNCEKEKYFHEDKSKFDKAIMHQTNMSFRVKYISDCLGIRIHDNFELNEIEVSI